MKELDVNSAIAGEIMTPYVIMLDINATFRKVIETLYANNISAIYIHNTLNNNYYIISQTEIINYLNSGGMFQNELPKISVSEIMKGPIEMLDINTPVDKIIRFMTEHNYKRVLITKNGKPSGVISTRDIMIWNNTYFKPAKPQVLLFMDNASSNFIAKHIFKQNIDGDIPKDLIDIYGGALSSISIITNQIMKKSGNIRYLMKEKLSILLEPYKKITGVLICDYNSIDLRRKLQKATIDFFKLYLVSFKPTEKKEGIHHSYDISPIIPIFES